MADQKRGRDAGDDAPKPPADPSTSTASETQDAPNAKDRTDQGQAIPVEGMNSANDE